MMTLRKIAHMKMIKVWQFEDAPKKYQRLSTNGGDEDWIVFVPKELEKEFISWLPRIDTCEEPDVFKVARGTIHIGSHA